MLAAGQGGFETETLPHSTTTKVATIAMTMAFVISEDLSWKALDNLLVMANALLAPETAIYPPLKYLLRKLWAAEAEATVIRHYHCRT